MKYVIEVSSTKTLPETNVLTREPSGLFDISLKFPNHFIITMVRANCRHESYIHSIPSTAGSAPSSLTQLRNFTFTVLNHFHLKPAQYT